ncbi:MAG: SiaB family protein kinase [Microscillaceae bacterium]|nr:SiaB family protein kinase [Microscillaceae bacterium]
MTNEFNFFEYHTQISHENILLSYKGPLSDVLLSEFSRDIRRKLDNEDPKIGKKVFSVFMELAQNVLYYSKEENLFGDNKDKVGTLVIVQNDTHYRLITGNLVFKKDVPYLQEKCEVINSLDRDALREYKRNLRNEPSGEESKGAGIGLVQAALTSSHPLEIQIQELSGSYAFFILFVNVKK